MVRVAFVMELKPGNEAIYRQKHDEIWPEMLESIHLQGLRNFSIFRRGLTLFAYLECDDRAQADAGRNDPVVRRWWKMMEPYMEYNADGTPWTETLEEVFHAP